MQYTNAHILAAVLNYFAQPIIKDLAGMKITSTSGYQVVENTIKKWLPVSPNYSLMNDIGIFIQGATDKAIVPILNSYLSNIPDEMIPSIAHSIVDTAIKEGKFDFADGRLDIGKEDFLKLKTLLDYNLPLKEEAEYKVITEMKAEAQAASPAQK